MGTAKITFHCTGLCNQSHPVFEHCKDCSHANFETVVPYKNGNAVVYFNPVFGPDFRWQTTDGFISPRKGSPLWEAFIHVHNFALRNTKYWNRKYASEKKGKK